MTNDTKSLQDKCDAIFRGCADAIDWVGAVRGNSSSINKEAPDLIMTLRRKRNLARRLA